jgi:creatinine amidohydrolase/Fe(II)-dependent formamide hydrolase-like protein
MLELAKIPFPEVERLAKSGRALVILPVGVVEEHGAHLPLGMDSFAAEVYAASTAPHLEEAGYEVVVARAAIDFPGTLSLEPDDFTVPGCGYRSVARAPWAEKTGYLERPPAHVSHASVG